MHRFDASPYALVYVVSVNCFLLQWASTHIHKTVFDDNLKSILEQDFWR